MELKAKLQKPYTEDEKADFITEYIYKKGYQLQRTDNTLEAWGLTQQEQDAEDLANQQKGVRSVRNMYLETTDKFMLIDYPITEQTRDEYKLYRQYLRDYTNGQNWWKNNPKTFEEWQDK